MNTDNHALYELIKTLKKSEIKHIRNSLVSLTPKKGESVLLQLFNMLCKTKHLPKKELYSMLQTLRTKQGQKKITANAFKVHKNYLKTYVLKFLVNNSDNQLREWHEKLEMVQVLIQRNLFSEALHQIKLFKKEVSDSRYKFYAIAANYYMGQLLQLTGDIHLASRALKLAEENSATNYQLYITSKIYHYYIKAFNLQMGGYLISDKSTLLELSQMLIDPIRDSDMDQLLFEDKYFLLNAMLITSRLEANFEEALVCVRKLWAMMQQKLKPEAMHGFNTQISLLSEYLECTFQAKSYKEMREIFAIYQSLVLQHQRGNPLSNGLLYHYRFLISYTTANGNIHKALEELSRFYKKSPSDAPITVRKRIEIDLAYGYYQIGSHSLSLQYLEAIMGLDASADTGIRLKDFLLLYALLINFDMLNGKGKDKIEIDVFEANVISFKRRIQAKSKNLDTRVEATVIRFFVSYIRNVNNKAKCITAFRKMQFSIGRLEKEGVLYLRQINNSINLIEWAQQRQLKLFGIRD